MIILSIVNKITYIIINLFKRLVKMTVDVGLLAALRIQIFDKDLGCH